MSADRNPFRSLERQFERMQRQLEEAFELWNVDQFGQTETEMLPRRTGMGIDLADHGDEYELTADVPGFEKDDIELRLSDNTIHITAERETETAEESEEQDEFYIKSERERQALSRSIRIPEPIDEDAVEATCRNGVLTITLPKEEGAELDGKTIDIE